MDFHLGKIEVVAKDTEQFVTQHSKVKKLTEGLDQCSKVISKNREIIRIYKRKAKTYFLLLPVHCG